jgi:putative transposase
MATFRQKPSSYALTISTHLQHRHFQRTANAELFIATLFRYRDQGKFLLHGFVVMPDHVHILLTPAIDQSTAKCVQFIKGGYSFAIREHSPKEIWHSSHHEHRIRDVDDYNHQLRYIAHNPTRKHFDEGYAHIHTSPAHKERIDPAPSHLIL